MLPSLLLRCYQQTQNSMPCVFLNNIENRFVLISVVLNDIKKKHPFLFASGEFAQKNTQFTLNCWLLRIFQSRIAHLKTNDPEKPFIHSANMGT